MGGGPVSAFMSETSLDQFFKWRAHRERELSEPTRIELYLASIRAMLFEIPFNIWGKESKVPAEKFIIKFSYDGKPTKQSEEEIEEIRRKSSEQTFAVMDGLLNAVAGNQRAGVDPSAGYLMQTTFDSEKSPINGFPGSPPLSPTESENIVPTQSYATENTVPPPVSTAKPKKGWTGGPR